MQITSTYYYNVYIYIWRCLPKFQLRVFLLGIRPCDILWFSTLLPFGGLLHATATLHTLNAPAAFVEPCSNPSTAIRRQRVAVGVVAKDSQSPRHQNLSKHAAHPIVLGLQPAWGTSTATPRAENIYTVLGKIDGYTGLPESTLWIFSSFITSSLAFCKTAASKLEHSARPSGHFLVAIELSRACSLLAVHKKGDLLFMCKSNLSMHYSI